MSVAIRNELPPLEPSQLCKHFAYAEITWNFENLSFAFCSDRKYMASTDFTLVVPIETTWGMALEIRRDDNMALLYLTLRENVRKKLIVRTFFSAYIVDASGERSRQTKDVAHYFTVGGTMRVDVSSDLLPVIIQTLRSGFDCLKLRCSLLVHVGYTPRFPPSEHPGLASLCTDLAKLHMPNMFQDVTINMQGHLIPVHRAMLAHRCPVLHDLVVLNQPSEKKAVNLHLSDSEALDKLLSYLYTGDLGAMLSEPTLMVMDYINRFRVPRLWELYPLEKYALKTKLDATEHKFEWTLVNVLEMNVPLSTIFQEEGMGSQWKLTVSMSKESKKDEKDENDDKGDKDEKDDEKDEKGEPKPTKKYFSLEAELLSNCNESYVDAYLKLDILGRNGDCKLATRKFKRMAVGDKEKLSSCLFDGDYLSGLLVDNALAVRFTVKIHTGETTPVILDHSPNSPLCFTTETSYMLLSSQLRDIFDTHDYCDAIITVDSATFKAHKFLLAARSKQFHTWLGEKPNAIANIGLSNIRGNLFKMFLEYLYTGVLSSVELDNIRNIARLANDLNVASLPEQCQKIIRDSLTEETVLDVLVNAHESKDSMLTNAALHFIGIHFKQLLDGLECVGNIYPRLYSQAKIYIKNNHNVDIDEELAGDRSAGAAEQPPAELLVDELSGVKPKTEQLEGDKLSN